ERRHARRQQEHRRTQGVPARIGVATRQVGFDVLPLCPMPQESDRVEQQDRVLDYRGLPPSTQRWKTSTLAAGQAPSHGIGPARSRFRMASAWGLTSSYDQRSKAKLIDRRSVERKSGLTCCSKLSGSSAAGIVITFSSSVGWGASAEMRAPGVASQTHH